MKELEELKQRLATERPAGWDEMPDLPLYMDQVVGYVSRQLISFEDGEQLTSAMINNYIKDGLLPRTKAKKYDQEHLAYLTAILALKQVLSVREMRALIELSGEVWDKKQEYTFFCQSLDEALKNTAEHLDPDTSEHDLPKLAVTLALRSYANGLACRRVLSVLCERKDRSDLLDKKKKKVEKQPQEKKK